MSTRRRRTLWTLTLVWVSASAEGQDPRFRRGDVDHDGSRNVSDAVAVLRSLFAAGALPLACDDAADVDDDGRVLVTDAVYLLSFLFRQGDPPPHPFLDCAPDPTADELGCAGGSNCSGGEFFVVDRSGSMQDSGELQIARREVIARLEQLSESDVFAIIFFDRALIRFPSAGNPIAATPENIALGTEWVLAVLGGSGGCPGPALLAGLELARRSDVDRDSVWYVSDGGGTCPGRSEQEYLAATLESVTRANEGLAEIHCIGIGVSERTIQDNFLRDLAQSNRGTYRRVR